MAMISYVSVCFPLYNECMINNVLICYRVSSVSAGTVACDCVDDSKNWFLIYVNTVIRYNRGNLYIDALLCAVRGTQRLTTDAEA